MDNFYLSRSSKNECLLDATSNNSMNYEILVRLKKRFFIENHEDLIGKLSFDQENIFNFHLEKDLYLTDKVNFTINK